VCVDFLSAEPFDSKQPIRFRRSADTVAARFHDTKFRVVVVASRVMTVVCPTMFSCARDTSKEVSDGRAKRLPTKLLFRVDSSPEAIHTGWLLSAVDSRASGLASRGF
jgi:hypothetical protein